jgi:hypothetical protein
MKLVYQIIHKLGLGSLVAGNNRVNLYINSTLLRNGNFTAKRFTLTPIEYNSF